MNSSTQSRVPSFLRVATLTLAGTILLFVLASRADAATYCVDKVDPSCTTQSNFISQALAGAQANPGPDRVLIGPGTFPMGTGVGYIDSTPGNTVEIIGSGNSGPDQTVLGNFNTVGSQTSVSLHGPAGSSISELTVTIPSNSDGNADTGIYLGSNNMARNVRIDGVDAVNGVGIYTNESRVEGALINMKDTDGNFGIRNNSGDSQILDSKITSDLGVNNVDPGGSVTIERSWIDAKQGAQLDGGRFDIRDSVIEVQPFPGSAGIRLENPNLGDDAMGATLDGVTIVGNNVASGTTGIFGEADNAGESVNLDVSNTVIWGTANTYTLHATGATVTVDNDFTAFNNGDTSSSTGVGGVLNYTLGSHDDLEDGPGFVNPGDGNYFPSSNSALIDEGDPAAPTAGRTDFAGDPRACQGGAGTIRRDIGAYEFKTNPADDCTYPETTLTGPAAFGLASIDAGTKVPLTIGSSKADSTFRCGKTDPPTETCPTGNWPVTGLGTVPFFAQAVDQFGNVDPTPATHVVSFFIEKGDPGPDPDPDVTAPRVLKLKAPKTTKKARVKVTFRSSEAASKFTCRLNRAKAKKCKSPWKTPKLKKGKNTVTVWATDAAGNRSKPAKRVIKRK